MNEELQELIASSVTNKSLVDVVRISHPQAGDVYLSDNIKNNGITIIDENGQSQEVMFANSALTDESTGRILLNERTFTLQGYNDIIADYEDAITDKTIRPKLSVLQYISDMDGNLSTISAGPYNYFIRRVKYTQKNNSCQLLASTSPTNDSETGRRMTTSLFETLRGFV